METSGVRVISRRAIREFAQRFPDSLSPLNHWANVFECSNWNNPAEISRAMNSADFVQDYVGFDIGGNKYRLIAFIQFRRQVVLIKHILTYSEYDKGAWKR